MSRVRASAISDPGGSSEHGSAPSSRRRGRRRGVEIRPGSVKQARVEAGLSLGQVALGDISRTAIYFVETGKAKPSMETLQLIATRTNKPMDFFLPGGDSFASDQASLAEIERLVAVGDHAAAVEAGESLLARSMDVKAIAAARLQMAVAHIRLGQPVRARTLAAQARAHFESVGDHLMTAEALGWEAAGALMLQDPAAVGYAEEALRVCRTLKPAPVTTEARLLQILGTAYGSRHEHAKAIEVLEEALAVGAAFPDLRRLSFIYGNLSLAYQEIGNFAEAARYARRTMAIEETLHDALQIALTENNLANLVFLQGDVAGAIKHAESSLRRQEALGVESGRAHVLMTLAELELARGDLDAAERYARTAAEIAESALEITNVGEAHVWLAQVAGARGDLAAAAAEYEIAFAKFEAGNASEWLARGHALYADLLEKRGELAAANTQLRQALSAVGVGQAVAFMDRSAIA